MRTSFLITTVLVAILLVTAQVSFAAVPQMINYQGRLTDPGGAALDTTVSMDFAIYDDSTGSVLKWAETHPSVMVVGGTFSIILGTTVPIDDSVFNQPDRWLGVAVGGDPEIEPRTRLVSVGYSHRVSTVDGAAGGIISGDVSIQNDLFVSGQATIGPGHTNSGSYSFVAGDNNTASMDWSTVGGGALNTASGVYTTVPGGFQNVASSLYSTVGGGHADTARADAATVSGGQRNVAEGVWSTVSGGQNNIASYFQSTVGGGKDNISIGESSTVGGGDANEATGTNSTVGGGGLNEAGALSSTVAGGQANTANGQYSTVGGGALNTASGFFSAVPGGNQNIASGDYSIVGGGYENDASGAESTIGGGKNNEANNPATTVAGGGYNTASEDWATVGGGGANTASGGFSTVTGGYGNIASGHYSFICGGQYNVAAGEHSFAGGWSAKANHNGAFVWGSHVDSDFSSERIGQFRIRANGGARFDINNGRWLQIYDDGMDVITTSMGAHLTIGGVWTNASDRNLKENFTIIDGREILDRIAHLPITQWNYKSENEDITHIGPVAQDFYSLFGLGGDDKSISTIDPAGIALAAIQALHEKTVELEKKSSRIEQLEAQMAEMQIILQQLLAERQ